MRFPPYLAFFIVSFFSTAQLDSSESDIDIQKMILIGEQLIFDSPDEAIEIFDEALLLSNQKDEKQLRAVCLNRLGAAYWSKGELVESIKRHQLSINTADSLGDMSLVMRNIGSLGNVYDAAGYNASCVEYFRQALQYFQKEGNLNRIFVYYNNIGRSYLEANKLDSAKSYLNKANDMYVEDFVIMRPLLLSNLAELYLKLGENELAESFITESLELATDRGDQHTICRLKRLQAEQLLDTNDPERALVKALKAEEIAQLTGRSKLIELTSRTLFKAHRANGNASEAFDVLDRANEQEQLLKNIRVKNQLDILRYEGQDKKIASLEEQRLIEQSRAETNRKVIFALLVLVLIVSFLLFQLYKSRNEIRNKTAQLDELSEFKTKVLAIVSHDLRSPIASFSSAIAIAQEQSVENPMLQDIFGKLKHEVARVLTLQDTLISWAREQISGAEVEKKEISLKEVFEQVVIDSDDYLKDKKISVVFQMEFDSLTTDEKMLNIILRNVLINAIKFSQPESDIIVKTTKDNDNQLISIQDFGIGMSKEQLERLFSYDLNRTRGTSGENGSGIGLTLCQDFILALGGQIRVESVEGVGSTFTLVFPR